MTQINLLPWRETLREEQKNEFLILMGAAAGLALVILLITFYLFSSKVSRVEKANHYLEDQTELVDRKIFQVEQIKKQKEELIARREALETVEIQRVNVVHLLEQVTIKLPEGVYLTEMKKEGPLLYLSGRAESNTRVSELMSSIDSSRWVKNPLLTEIKSPDDETRTFQIRMEQELPDVEWLRNKEKQQP